jgi:pimeloyl-ACP methyl ester carboxylesterase
VTPPPTPRFDSYDGTRLGYRIVGDGAPLVCIPGGPGRSVDYLGDLGGLAESQQLVLLDPRGVGESSAPADPTTLRVDRLVDDVEALRLHLGLDRMHLLAHSAGAVLATLYAARFPKRLSSLVLVTPGLAAVGVYGDPDAPDLMSRWAGESWYPAAIDAWERIQGGDTSFETFAASRPPLYARWDAASQAHATSGMSERNLAARTGYFAGLELDVDAIRATLKKVRAPAMLYVGELDPLVTPAMAADAAHFFARPSVVVQAGAGHFPWVDDGARFAAAVDRFLG